MNKVIIINLGGTAWQLEEGGYDVLRVCAIHRNSTERCRNGAALLALEALRGG